MADIESNEGDNSPALTDEHMSISTKAVMDTSFSAHTIHVYLLGMSIILGGLTGGWNEGLKAGLWSFFIDFCFISVGFTMLAFCLAEMTSIVTFPGGAYGYVRSTLGPYLGFMTGCSELLMYNFYTMCAVNAVANCVTTIGLQKKWELTNIFWFYFGIVVFNLRGDVYFWVWMCLFAVLSILAILLYIFAAFSEGEKLWNQSLVRGHGEDFFGTPSLFFDVMCKAAWFFVGIETISVAGGRIENATTVVPRAILLCFGSVLVLSLLVFFATALQYRIEGWESLPDALSPLSLIWHKSLHVNQDVANLITIPANFASALGFMYGSMHLLRSMSLSGLMPAFFQPSSSVGSVPMRSLLTCAVVQCAVLILGKVITDVLPFYEIAVLGATVVYMFLFAAYVTFYYKFAGMQRGFRSPLGPGGAYVGMFVFALVFMTIAVFHAPDFPILVFGLYWIFMTCYYFVVVETRQCFSEEEQKHFMKAYIINANMKKRMTPFQRFVVTLRSQWCGCLSPPSANIAPSTDEKQSATAGTM